MGQTPFQVNGGFDVWDGCFPRRRSINSCVAEELKACDGKLAIARMRDRCPCPSDFCLQLAIVSGNFELGEIIKNHKDSDVGKRLHHAVSSVLFILLLCRPKSTERFPCQAGSSSFTFALPSSVFFLESPKYVPRRKESSHTLPLPSQHSHPLLRANSENTVSQSDPPVLPNKAATSPNPRQVPATGTWTRSRGLA